MNKPTMFNKNSETELYMIELTNMSYDELCLFIERAYKIDYELGCAVAQRIIMLQVSATAVPQLDLV